MHPKDLSIKDYTYHLPEDRIAVYPLPERDASRLLIYQEGNITEDIYRRIAHHIPEGSLLVFNNSKVIEARILFQKSTGGTVEIFCLEPDEQYPDISTAMLQQGKVYWQCLVGGASKWKNGQILEKKITYEGGTLTLAATYREKITGSFRIELTWDPPHLSFAEVLHYAGVIPLPPYLHRPAEVQDRERYQTIYAQPEGSVAAPTAGLHFTPAVFESLTAKNIHNGFVTLHVGAGTFKPVKSETMETHEMHSEFIDVRKELIEQLLAAAGPVIAVGTTSLRTIESLYWLGRKLAVDEQADIQEVGQWDAYENTGHLLPAKEALETLLQWMEKNKTDRLITKTRIIIAPGYKHNIANALITNFHQPQSTLLLLIAALLGDDWKKVYDYALENNFRFLSYGDGCLLWISP